MFKKDQSLKIASKQPGSSQPNQNQAPDEDVSLHLRMSRIKHKILVLSGKGGVGKSTVAVNLAVTLALAGNKVGLLDIDIHGPSVPRMLNLKSSRLRAHENTIIPITYGDNLKVMSMGLLMENEDQAVIWRGPMKMQIIRQFLKDVEWGDLDYLVVDSPPGTGDEPLSIVQLLSDADGAVIVTTPQEISLADVRKCIYFTRKLHLPVLGVIENMSGFVCPTCGDRVNIFRKGGGVAMAEQMQVPFLGSIPIEKEIVEASDEGKPYMQHFTETAAAQEFRSIVEKLHQNIARKFERVDSSGAPQPPTVVTRRIAIPVSSGKLSAQFGKCESFALLDLDEGQKKIVHHLDLPSPGQQPGILPKFLAGHGVHLVFASSMGEPLQELFREVGVDVILSVPEENPEALAQSFLDGTLISG